MTRRWMPDAAKLDEHVRRALRRLKGGATLDEVTRASHVAFWCEPLGPEVAASLRRSAKAGGVQYTDGKWRWRAKRKAAGR